MANTTRRLYLQVQDNGSPLSQVLSVQTVHGIDTPVAQCFVTLPKEPAGMYLNHQIVATTGAGNNVQRFSGWVRERRFTMPGGDGGQQYRITGRGNLTRAAEYQNKDSPTAQAVGGLTIKDLTGTQPNTDQAVVKAALTRCAVVYTAGDINGTGRNMGGRIDPSQPSPFLWPNGQPSILLAGGGSTAVLRFTRGAGMDGLTYIKRWDAVSAQVDSVTTPTTGGFYVTYDAPSGRVYRTRMGGRPRGTPDVPAFTEGVDISEGETLRTWPAGNGVIQRGFDDGRNAPSYASLIGAPLFTSTSDNIFTAPANPMIEWSTLADSVANGGGNGMTCDTVVAAIYLDVYREAVEGRYVTPRDDLIAPGMTILVSGPGNSPNRLGVGAGDPLWVKRVETYCGIAGFYQTLTVIGGGGAIDNGNPPVGT